MIKSLRFPLLHFIFGLILFASYRALSLLILIIQGESASLTELVSCMIHGLRLDLSVSGYLFILPLLLFPFLGTSANPAIAAVIKIYYRLMIVFITVLMAGNIIVIRFWGTLINAKALEFATQPKEMLASVTNLQILIILVSLAALYRAAVLLWKYTTGKALDSIPMALSPLIGAQLILIPLTFLTVRGGLQLIPVNEASAAFSERNELNRAAINPIWYLGNDLLRSGLTEINPFDVMPDSIAEGRLSNLIKSGNSFEHKFITEASRPNVVIIILESWTADIIEPLGGIKGVTPFFSDLCKQGLLFNGVYSSGFRTDQGLTSILSGFPSIPNHSVIRYVTKTEKLPSIVHSFEREQYTSSFFYGGELEFANMKNYLLQSGFKKTSGIEDYSTGQVNSKWGAHDGFVMTHQLDCLKKTREPFLSVLLTLSTHEPFESPVPTPFRGNSEPERFKKAAWYTDNCLKNYFNSASKESWFNNTVFVLVADHGHRMPLGRDYLDAGARKIPVLIFSKLLLPKYSGSVVSLTASQHDISSTLLNGLGMDAKPFVWSNNMLDSARSQFAYLNQDVAVTWITGSDTTIIPVSPEIVIKRNAREESTLNAKAYLQKLYKSFLDL